MIKRLGGSMTAGPLSMFPSDSGQSEKSIASEKAKNPFVEKLLASFGEEAVDAAQEIIRRMPIGQLQPGKYQPRQTFVDESLEDLAESIRAAGGIIQPLIVRTIANGRYEIIAGERRWRAAALIDLHEVPCVIRDDLSDERVLVVALIENIQRENLNVIEEAEGLSRLIKEFGMTHLQAANAVGKSRSAVSNLLRLTELPRIVRESLRRGELEMGHARALLGIDEAQQISLLNRIVQKKLTVRDVEAVVKRFRDGTDPKSRVGKEVVEEEGLEQAADQLSRMVGEWIDVKRSPTGRVCITLRSTDALSRLMKIVDAMVSKNSSEPST